MHFLSAYIMALGRVWKFIIESVHIITTSSRAFGIRLSRVLRKGHGLLLALLVTGVYGLFVFGLLGISDKQTELLSVIAQSLSGILGIGFGAALVLSQLLSRYAPGMRMPLTHWTLAYLLLYVIGILLPLTGLQGGTRMVDFDIDVKGLFYIKFSMGRISLVWTGLCLVLLPVYLHYLKEHLSPKGWLSDLKRSVAKERYEEYWVSYGTVALNALEAKDYLTFKSALTDLCNALLENAQGLKIVPSEPHHFYPHYFTQTWEVILKQIVDVNLEAVQSPAAFSYKAQVFRKLGEQAVQSSEKQSTFVACQAIAWLEKAGTQTIRLELEVQAIIIISQLVGVAEKALENDKMVVVVERAIRVLDTMVRNIIAGNWVPGEQRDQAARHGIDRIASIGDKAIQSSQWNILEDCVLRLSELSEFFRANGEVKRLKQACLCLGRLGRTTANRGLWFGTKQAIGAIFTFVITEIDAKAPDLNAIENFIKVLKDFGLGALTYCEDNKTTDDRGTVSLIVEKLCILLDRAVKVLSDRPAQKVLNALEQLAIQGMIANIPECPVKVAECLAGLRCVSTTPQLSQALDLTITTIKRQAFSQNRDDVLSALV